MSVTAKSVVFDIADSWGDPDYLGIRVIDFLFEGVSLGLVAADYVAYATNDWSSYPVSIIGDTSQATTGGVAVGGDCIFTISNITNQRAIVVFSDVQVFDEIRICNLHGSGTETDYGFKNVKVSASTDSITDTTYNAAIANSSVLGDTEWPEHSAVDETDWQTIWEYSSVEIVITTEYDSPLVELHSIVENPIIVSGEIVIDAPTISSFFYQNLYVDIASHKPLIKGVAITTSFINGDIEVSGNVESVVVTDIMCNGEIDPVHPSIHGVFGDNFNIESPLASVEATVEVPLVINGHVNSLSCEVSSFAYSWPVGKSEIKIRPPAVSGFMWVDDLANANISIDPPVISSLVLQEIEVAGDIKGELPKIRGFCVVESGYEIIKHRRNGQCRL